MKKMLTLSLALCAGLLFGWEADMQNKKLQTGKNIVVLNGFKNNVFVRADKGNDILFPVGKASGRYRHPQFLCQSKLQHLGSSTTVIKMMPNAETVANIVQKERQEATRFRQVVFVNLIPIKNTQFGREHRTTLPHSSDIMTIDFQTVSKIPNIEV